VRAALAASSAGAAAPRQTAAARRRNPLLWASSSSSSTALVTLPYASSIARWATSDASSGQNGSSKNDSSNPEGTTAAAALYLTSPEGGARGATPLLLGLMNYLERHLPDVGYFLPVGSPAADRDPVTGIDRRAELVAAASDHRALGDPREMVGVPEEEAALLIASGRTSELLDRIYAAFAAVRDRHDMVVVEGTGVGGSEFEAQVAAALGTPVLLTLNARNHHLHHQQTHPSSSSRAGGALSPAAASVAAAAAAAGRDRLAAGELYSAAMLKRQLFADHGVPLLGVAVNRAPASDHALLAQQLRRRFGVAGVTFAGAIPEDPVLSGVRLGEVQARLGAGLLCGGGSGGAGAASSGGGAIGQPGKGSSDSAVVLSDELHVDREFNAVVVASQRLEELLEALEALPPGKRPLVVTTVDRLDLVLGLLAAHVSVSAPPIAGIMLCPTAGGLSGLDGGGDLLGGGAGGLLAGVGGGDGSGGGVGAFFGETPHHPRSPHSFARRTVQRVFEGVARGGMYKGALLPVLAVGAPVFDVVRALGEMGGQIMPTSVRKIGQCR
jgi:BioD-like phosphotransacetylase family protein